MLDGMRPRRQLGKEENGNEKEMTQRIHGNSLVDLDEQTFEVFAFGKRQSHRVVGRCHQARLDADFGFGIDRGAGDDFLEQFRADAARA